MKRLGVFLLPPGRDASPSQVTPPQFVRFPRQFARTVEKGNAKVKCLAQEHNTMRFCSVMMARYWPSWPYAHYYVNGTFRAAIFEVPTTFPSLSFTSIPVNSSWFLIRTTLQIFAVARGRKENFVSLSLFDNWLMFDKKQTATAWFFAWRGFSASFQRFYAS